MASSPACRPFRCGPVGPSTSWPWPAVPPEPAPGRLATVAAPPARRSRSSWPSFPARCASPAPCSPTRTSCCRPGAAPQPRAPARQPHRTAHPPSSSSTAPAPSSTTARSSSAGSDRRSPSSRTRPQRSRPPASRTPRRRSRTSLVTPPAGAVLVTAAVGGTVSQGGATLTFAPGALRADAWVVIRTERRGVRGLKTTSLVYDLLAYDARTGAEITTFLSAPVLSVATDGSAAGAGIYYVAPDGSLEPIQHQRLRRHPHRGVAALQLVHHRLRRWTASRRHRPGAAAVPRRRRRRPAHPEPRRHRPRAVAPEQDDISFDGISGSSGGLHDRGHPERLASRSTWSSEPAPARDSPLGGTYDVTAAALDAGTFALTVQRPRPRRRRGPDLTAAAGTLDQAEVIVGAGTDARMTLHATSVSATLAAPSGPAVVVTGTAFDLQSSRLRHGAPGGRRHRGPLRHPAGLGGGSGWTLYNGYTTDTPLDGVTAHRGHPRGLQHRGPLGPRAVAHRRDPARHPHPGALSATVSGPGLVLAAGGATVLTLSAITGRWSRRLRDGGHAVGDRCLRTPGSPWPRSRVRSSSPINTRSAAAAGLPAGPYLRVP